MSLRAIASYVQRARRRKSPIERLQFAKAAEHYRELAELEEEVAGIRPKPPAPNM